MTSKKDLSERDICTQFIVPALQKAGWEIARQVREEVFFTDGRLIARGSKTGRGERKEQAQLLMQAVLREAFDENNKVSS